MMSCFSRYVTHLVLLTATLLPACEALEPDEEPRLVVQGFVDAGKPLPEIRLSQTFSPNQPYDDLGSAVSNAELAVTLGPSIVPYRPVEGEPGLYEPVVETLAEQGETFSLGVKWFNSRAEASGVVPPLVHIERLEVRLPEEPVSAVLLDSLALSDSLAVGARTGFIFPIEVAISWKPELGEKDLWVRAQLYPYTGFSSTVVDLFLRSDQILPEEDLPSSNGLRTWTGVYAVRVDSADDPLPVHKLRVALVRSGVDYARYASTRNAPERRAPVSNVSGGIGIFTAISVDSTHLRIEHNAAVPIISPLIMSRGAANSTADPARMSVHVVPADERTTRDLLRRLSKEGL